MIPTPSTPHYAWVESEHPYKPASVNNYRVAFPESVQWMSVEFDPRCGTAQMEDVLQIHIRNPTFRAPSSHSSNSSQQTGVQFNRHFCWPRIRPRKWPKSSLKF